MITTDKVSQWLAIEADPANLKLRILRFNASDVVVNSREHTADPFRDEVVLVLVNRHELQGKAAVRRIFVLPDKTVTMQPTNKSRLIGGDRMRLRQLAHLASSGQPEPHSRSQFFYWNPARFASAIC